MSPRPDRDPPAGWTLEPAAEPAEHPPTLRHPAAGIVLRRRLEPALAPAWYRLDLAYPPEGVVDARLILEFEDGSRLPTRLAKTDRNRFLGLFRPAKPAVMAEVHLSGSAPLDAPGLLALTPMSARERRFALLRRAVDVLRGDPRSFVWRAARFAVQVQRQGRTTIPVTAAELPPAAAYRLWQDRFDEREQDGALHRALSARLAERPRFTVIADPDLDDAQAASLKASLEAQIHTAWDFLRPRLGQGRSEALNGAIAEAAGEFVFLPRPGTVFRPHALAVFAAAVARFPAVDIVYADDDDLGPEGRENPRFKPAWSPARALSWDYVGDPCCIRTACLVRAGGMRELGRPAQRHDLLLRVADGAAPVAVLHIAQVLSHDAVPSRASSTPEDRATVRAHVERPEFGARVLADPRSPHPRVVFSPAQAPLVSLIIPTRDHAALLRVAVDSIRAKTAYKRYEILVVDNGSREPETLQLFERWAGDPTIRILPDPRPFNYAALNNRAVAAANGDVVGLVNNDVEVTEGTWLDEMVGWASRPEVGCVGAKLLYPDGRLQHGGVVTGIAGAAGHRRKRARRDERGSVDDLVTVNEVSAVTGACLVVRKSTYLEVGGLDEAMFAVAYNDVDFCLRVEAAGYRNLWTPFAELIHHESVSRGRDLGPRTAERFNRENTALRLRWGNRLLDDPYYSPNLTVDGESGTIRTQ